MANHKFAANGCDQISEISSMTDVLNERKILLIDGLPVGTVKFRIVEILTLDPPRLAEDLLPLGTWIDAHFERRNIQRPIADLDGNGTIRRDNAPGCTARLIKKLLPVTG